MLGGCLCRNAGHAVLAGPDCGHEYMANVLHVPPGNRMAGQDAETHLEDAHADTDTVFPGRGPVELLHTPITDEGCVQGREIVSCTHTRPMKIGYRRSDICLQCPKVPASAGMGWPVRLEQHQHHGRARDNNGSTREYTPCAATLLRQAAAGSTPPVCDRLQQALHHQCATGCSRLYTTSVRS